MDSRIVTMPGYRIHEYRLVVPLSEALEERLGALRSRLFERHRVKQGGEGAGGLTVLRAHALEQSESRLVERLQQLVWGMEPFRVELDGFAAYPSHSIYIQVPTRAPFSLLVQELKKLKWLMNLPGQEPHYIPEPQLVRAQGLKPMPFIGMWMECEHSEFRGRFLADRLLLLRRPAGSGSWEALHSFTFPQVAASVKQGVLFG